MQWYTYKFEGMLARSGNRQVHACGRSATYRCIRRGNRGMIFASNILISWLKNGLRKKGES